MASSVCPERHPYHIMVKISKPLTPPVKRVSPSWPSVAHTKGRKLPMCLDCERSRCVCDLGSNASLSLCSEDDKKSDFGETDPSESSFISSDGEGFQGRKVQRQGKKWSFLGESDGHNPENPALKTVSSREEEGIPTCSTPYGGASASTAASRADEAPNNKTTNKRITPQQEWNPPSIADRQIFIEEFTGSLQASVTPELTSFTVRAKEDVVIYPQSSVQVPTDVILHPPARHVASQGTTPAITFCPLSPSSIDLTEGSRLARIMGGSVGVHEQKRLSVSCGNPSTYINVFFPRGTIIGVVEIFPHRY